MLYYNKQRVGAWKEGGNGVIPLSHATPKLLKSRRVAMKKNTLDLHSFFFLAEYFVYPSANIWVSRTVAP